MRSTIFLFFIVLLITSVSAQDFNALGDTTINAVPCGSTFSNVSIQNTRDNQSAYEISVDGDASEWVTFSSIGFNLLSQQTAIINTYYTIPCTTTPGTYYTNVYFTDGETEKQLTQEVLVAIPDNLNVTAQQTSAVIAPCETASYAIDIQNPLNFTEIYTIKADGHPNVHVSEKTAVLQGNERKIITVSVTPDDCTQSGSFPLTVDISAEKSRRSKQTPLEFIIKSTDIPILAEGVSTIRTDYVDSTADVTIENTGDRTTTYSLTLKDIPWASISPSTVILTPGQSKTTALRLAPARDVPKGAYTLTLIATVEQTGIQYSKEIKINLKPQTLFERNPSLVIGLIILGVLLIVGIYFLARYMRSDKFKARIKRIKEKRAALKQNRKEEKQKKEQKKAEERKKQLEQQRKEAERKKAEQAKAKQQAEKELRKNNYVIAHKAVITGTQSDRKIKAYALIFTILVILIATVLWGLISPNGKYVLFGLIILAVIYAVKKLSRGRTIRESWKLFLANKTTTINAWKKGLSQFSITSEQPIKKFKLLIRKTRAKIAPSPAVYQTIAIKANAPEDALGMQATFTVPKTWLARKQVELEDLRLARYSNQAWNSIPIKKTGESKHAVHFTADISKYGTYSLYAKVKPEQRKSHALLWAFVGLAVLIAAAIALSPQPSTTSKGIPTQSWEQGNTHSLDLNKYFKDPDGDKLTFNVTATKHITIDIRENMAYFTPETGWTGEERVRFIATDNKGGDTASNTVALRVQKQLIPAKLQPFIAIGITLLAIILLIWAARSQNKK